MSSRKVAHRNLGSRVALLMLPLAACAAPPVADQAPMAQQQVSTPALPSAEPPAQAIPDTPAAAAVTQAVPRGGATTAGRPVTPARPAPSNPVSTPLQAPGAASGTALEPPPAAQAPAAAPAATSPAQAERPPQVVMPGSATPGAGSLLQTILALVLVLALLLGLAWVMKRFGPRGMGTSANLRLVGALNIGGRERIMVVEVGNQWIVVGASPGRVNALATMPRQEGAPGQDAQLAAQGSTAAPSAASFGEWLKNTIDKRNAK
ncbi:flagellar biosynthetic protein FliO [Massilia sp. H6]|uniref:flagellar biosynthetic protein FliO n=1 Tax=Massilia sp. H6 TaxID=2970464 RepID=UPI00216963AC|nr:flagellar biosynthetic protein FliO [Massilia sp. H6]UVW27895.1 flagellar biosynthetic protein FliO [Massilia sp. H6]